MTVVLLTTEHVFDLLGYSFHMCSHRDHEMSQTWVTLIQKQRVLLNLMCHTHVSAIFGSAEACLPHHTWQNKRLCWRASVMFGLKFCYHMFCHAIAIFTLKLRWESSICLASVTLFIPSSTPMAFFFFQWLPHCVSTALSNFYPKKKPAPNVSLINESHSWVWFITDLTHRLTSVGWGPCWGEVHKNLPTPEQKPSVR